MVRVYAGAEWLRGTFPGIEVSPLGGAVADLLGDVFLGIYHLPNNALRRATWGSGWCVQIVLPNELATFDGSELTRLVVLAHDRAIRVSVEGVGPGYLRLRFHQRQREGALHERHPGLEEHVLKLRGLYGSGGDES